MSDKTHECTKRECYYCYEINRLKQVKQQPQKPIKIKSDPYYKQLLKSA